MTTAQRNATSTQKTLGTRASVTQFNVAELKTIEAELAKRIGPLAAALIRKAQKKSQAIDEAIALVAVEIDDESEHAVFTKRAKATTGNTQPPSMLTNSNNNLAPPNWR